MFSNINKLKVENSPDLHSYYRAFPTEFFKKVSNIEFFKKLPKEKGIIDGDLHVENVDFMISDSGKAFLGINDFDALAEGKLSHDLIRLFGSAKVLYRELEWKDFYRAYKKGLKKDNDYDFGKIYNKGIEKAEENAKELMGKYVKKNQDGSYVFKERKSVSYDLSEQEKKKLKNVLEDKFQGIKIHDSYLRIKDSGGSAGKKRYQVLVQLKNSDEIRWMDVKLWDQSDYDKAINQGQDSLSNQKKLEKVKSHLYDGKLDESLGRIEIDDENYSVKFVDQFAAAVDFEKLKDKRTEDEIMKFILDEAYIVGKFHRNSLNDQNLLSYIDEWDSLSAREMDEQILHLIGEIKQDYERAKNL